MADRSTERPSPSREKRGRARAFQMQIPPLAALVEDSPRENRPPIAELGQYTPRTDDRNTAWPVVSIPGTSRLPPNTPANSDLVASRGSRSSNSMATRFALIRNGAPLKGEWDSPGIKAQAIAHSDYRSGGFLACGESYPSTPVRRMPAYPFSLVTGSWLPGRLQRKDKNALTHDGIDIREERRDLGSDQFRDLFAQPFPPSCAIRFWRRRFTISMPSAVLANCRSAGVSTPSSARWTAYRAQ